MRMNAGCMRSVAPPRDSRRAFYPTMPRQSRFALRAETAEEATAEAMSGETQEKKTIPPAIIIGAGRVGQALKDMGSGEDLLIGRHDFIPDDAPEGPIFIATRNNDLDAVLAKVPAERHEDLVFMQNGYLQPYLDKRNLSDATQVLVYFAVAKLGDPPTDGITDLNPEGLTAAHGKWAQAAADRFANADLSCKVLDKESFERAMFEKLIWICSFMLVGAQYPGATVGDVEANHTAEVTALINELGAAVPGVNFEPQLSERLRAYARSVAHFPTAVKEFEWRNGYFNELSKNNYMSGGKVDPCPLHSDYLAKLGIGKVIPYSFKGYRPIYFQEELEEQDKILTEYEKQRAERKEKLEKEKRLKREQLRKEKEAANLAKQERELKEEETMKARQLEMAKTAAEEETKRSRRNKPDA